MTKLTDLPAELIIRIFLCAANPAFAAANRLIYSYVGNPTPRLCYKFARSLGQGIRSSTIASCLPYRFLSTQVLDQITNGNELITRRRRKKSEPAMLKVKDIKIPARLFTADIKEDDADGQPPVAKRRRLTYSAPQKRLCKKKVKLVEHLLSLGVSVKGAKGSTGLVLSSKAGNLKMVKLLLKKGADPTAGGENKALLMAVVHGHFGVVKRLVKAGAPVNTLALRYAVQKNHLDIVAWIMKQGVAPDMVTIQLLDQL